MIFQTVLMVTMIIPLELDRELEDEEQKVPEIRKNDNNVNDKVDYGELCNDPKRNRDVEESSREYLADAEGSSHCNQEHLIVTREARDSPTAFIPSGIPHNVDLMRFQITKWLHSRMV
ncbi:hypothetical protein Bca52824_006488 [Brassica carinata]|uniref:Uncharacterized protein n=1 Tax=Brassica carinata TaxID=52824 RepID=A0A8X7W7D7_BRACI|nr:hypothetical protein Bca52824_006488 [Brassica carinata]